MDTWTDTGSGPGWEGEPVDSKPIWTCELCHRTLYHGREARLIAEHMETRQAAQTAGWR